MKLFLIHCGFYDEKIFNGVYEFHVNIPIAANSEEEAKKEVQSIPSFTSKRMHIDGIQMIQFIGDYQIILNKV